VPQHEFTGEIPIGAEDVYSFVADIENLPTYLPLMTHARSLGEDKVEIETEVKGRVVHMAAWFRPDAQTRRIDWGSSTDDGYQGWMQVHEASDDSGSASVEFHLTTPLEHTLDPYFRAALQFVTTALT
jgi:hypothetical protein